MKKILILTISFFIASFSFSQSPKGDRFEIIDYITSVTNKSIVVVNMEANRDSVKFVKLKTTHFDRQNNKWIVETLYSPIEIKQRYPNLDTIVKTPISMIESFNRMENQELDKKLQ